jgi:hypothetical protein
MEKGLGGGTKLCPCEGLGGCVSDLYTRLDNMHSLSSTHLVGARRKQAREEAQQRCLPFGFEQWETRFSTNAFLLLTRERTALHAARTLCSTRDAIADGSDAVTR